MAALLSLTGAVSSIMIEYDCKRCGIHLFLAVDAPHEGHCAKCRFIESIKDPEARRETAGFLDRMNPAPKEAPQHDVRRQ